jgi:hypothetical protein
LNCHINYEIIAIHVKSITSEPDARMGNITGGLNIAQIGYYLEAIMREVEIGLEVRRLDVVGTTDSN